MHTSEKETSQNLTIISQEFKDYQYRPKKSLFRCKYLYKITGSDKLALTDCTNRVRGIFFVGPDGELTAKHLTRQQDQAVRD